MIPDSSFPLISGLDAASESSHLGSGAASKCKVESVIHVRAITHLHRQEYAQAATLWEQTIADDPSCITAYWYLGLALLLQGQESESQLIWMTPLLEAEPDQIEQWSAELSQVLSAEADRQAADGALQTAWLIRQHCREIDPGNLSNLLQILELELKLDNLDLEKVTQAAQIVHQLDCLALDQIDLLLRLIRQLLEAHSQYLPVLELIEASVTVLPETQPLLKILLEKVRTLYLTTSNYAAVNLSKICIRLAPNDTETLSIVIPALQRAGGEHLWLSIRLAEQCLEQSSTLADQAAAADKLLTSLMMTGGNWQRASEVYQRYKSLLIALAQGKTEQPLGSLTRVLALGAFFFYFEDNPSSNRPIRNRLAALGQERVRTVAEKPPYVYPQPDLTKPLKVGYLSENLCRHSVGWLAQSLLKHHHPDRVEVHLYSTRQNQDSLQQALMERFGDRFHTLITSIPRMADQIYQDQIDILVELDSITSFYNCAIVALKPAPVQVNWMGYDAAGLPAVDYFIADPYVLPESAQDYYSETIWRLPHTYIALGGFEVGVPNLRRDQLGIPTDAIVYMSSQTGHKRNPDNLRLQMQILCSVPNSYFLVKSLKSDQEALEAFFYQIAEETGVNRDRLRFLPRVSSEAIHRANLGIADVVLDTYPYTGATTTLETLWMGIPIVTKVGEQFSARNSYTMMMNAGVTEGIAWTDGEYIEWGVRLGQDSSLRQQIFWRLQQARRTSPLWKTQQFAQAMETAYTQMWERYGATQ